MRKKLGYEPSVLNKGHHYINAVLEHDLNCILALKFHVTFQILKRYKNLMD